MAQFSHFFTISFAPWMYEHLQVSHFILLLRVVSESRLLQGFISVSWHTSAYHSFWISIQSQWGISDPLLSAELRLVHNDDWNFRNQHHSPWAVRHFNHCTRITALTRTTNPSNSPNHHFNMTTQRILRTQLATIPGLTTQPSNRANRYNRSKRGLMLQLCNHGEEMRHTTE